MATTFAFPASPTVDQVVTLPDGNQVRWNGYAWVEVGSAGGGGSSVWIGDTPPTDKVTYPMWWSSTTLQLYIWYDDGTSQQWVESSADPAGLISAMVAEAPVDGKIYSRKNAAWLPAGTVGAQVLVADTVAQVLAALQLNPQPTHRNMVINGDMTANQFTNTHTPPVGGASKYICDMWKVEAGNINPANLTASLVSAVGLSEFPNYIRLTSSGVNTPLAAGYVSLIHRVESIHMTYLNWGTANAAPVTLSFWARVTGLAS